MLFEKKIKIFLCTIGIIFIGIQQSWSVKHGIVIDIQEKISRLGDYVYSYGLANLFSLKYNIPFYMTPFKYSELFLLHECDQFLDEKTRNSFEQVVEILKEDELLKHLKTSKKSTLFTLYYDSRAHILPELKENFPTVHAYLNMYFYAQRCSALGSFLKKAFTPKVTPHQIFLPDDKITVAVHVRKGSGPDTEMKAIQYQDEFDYILRRDVALPTFVKSLDFKIPWKFPSEQFYVDQIIKLSEMLNHAPLFVYVFSDSKHPEKIVERFKKRITLPNITLTCNKQDACVRHISGNAIIEDIYNMSRFDCLIKAESGFSLTSQFIGDYKIIIVPMETKRLMASDLNQFFIEVTGTGIVFYNSLTNDLKALKFDEVTQEHKDQALSLFSTSMSSSFHNP